MADRNWTRRSIEELVDRYMGDKTVAFGAMIRECSPIMLCDGLPCAYDDPNPPAYYIDVGDVDSNGETIAIGHERTVKYYPRLIASYRNYIQICKSRRFQAINYLNDDSRYKYSVGSMEDYGSAAGTLLDANGKEHRFMVLTVPNVCNHEDIKEIIVNCATFLSNPITKNFVIVTSDPVNELTLRTESLIPISYGCPMRLNRTFYVTSDSVFNWPSYGYDHIFTLAGSTDPVNVGEDASDSVYRNRYLWGMNLVDPNHNAGPSAVMISGYVDPWGQIGTIKGHAVDANSGAENFVNYVKNNYEGSIEYIPGDATATRNTLSMSFIMVDDVESQEELEAYAFMLSRWFLDGFHYRGSYKSENQAYHTVPQRGAAHFGVDLPLLKYNSFDYDERNNDNKDNVVVKYNRVVVNV